MGLAFLARKRSALLFHPEPQKLGSAPQGAICGARTKAGGRCKHPAPAVGSKPESTDGLVGSTVWDRVAAGLVRVCGPARFGACETGVRGCGGLVALGVGLRCAGRCAPLR